eukprot:147362-Rhodomonas_salina.1
MARGGCGTGRMVPCEAGCGTEIAYGAVLRKRMGTSRTARRREAPSLPSRSPTARAYRRYCLGVPSLLPWRIVTTDLAYRFYCPSRIVATALAYCRYCPSVSLLPAQHLAANVWSRCPLLKERVVAPALAYGRDASYGDAVWSLLTQHLVAVQKPTDADVISPL